MIYTISLITNKGIVVHEIYGIRKLCYLLQSRGDFSASTWDLPQGPLILMKSLYSSNVIGGYKGGFSGVTSSFAGSIGISLFGL